MAPVSKKTQQHLTHPHPLIHHSDDEDYLCGGCKTPGFGNRFRCHACVYDMHEYCSNCPNELSSFMHNHTLSLVLRKSQGPRLNDRICDVCRDSVEGLFYRCKDCDFDAHPLCTQLPKELRHVIDNKHMLRLQKLPFGNCVVCKTDCSNLWIYGCDVCKVSIHYHCLLEPYDSPSTPQEIPVPPQAPSISTSRGIPFAPQQAWSTGPPPFSYASFDAYGGGQKYGYSVPYGVPSDTSYPYPYDYNSNFGQFYSHGYVPSPHYNVHHHQQQQSNMHHYLQQQSNMHHYQQQPSNMHHYQQQQSNMHHYQQQQPPPQPQQSEVGNGGSTSGGKFKKSMFALVGNLTLGVMSSLIFGAPLGFSF